MDTNKALQVILQEMDTASRNGYQGIAFDESNVRTDIWLSYCKQGLRNYQAQKYPRQMWPSFKLGFNLLDFLFTKAGYPGMVQHGHLVHFFSPDGLMLMLMFAGSDSHPNGPRFVELCAHRVAEVIDMLEQPLEDTSTIKFR